VNAESSYRSPVTRAADATPGQKHRYRRVRREDDLVFPDLPARPLKRCARCGHPTRADRMVKGFGRDCAALLGLIGGTVDVGQSGPDLLDVLADEIGDACDGWDRDWRRVTGRRVIGA
jgi:hypothetical protein